MKIADITKLHIEATGGGSVLKFEAGPYRWHVWLTRDPVQLGDVLYRNRLVETGMHRADKTARLKLYSPTWLRVRAHLDAYIADGSKLKAAEERAEHERIEKEAADKAARAELMRNALLSIDGFVSSGQWATIVAGLDDDTLLQLRGAIYAREMARQTARLSA